MLSKFETKSSRVKGLAFHAKRPWILCSLHNGVIQLWDYRMETLIDKFEEHDGPVRGIDFHLTQPLFVSGGDDSKIRVWNFQMRRCLFNLNGHLDYIRTVKFHHEYPWIISASDDQTIRIWNWQSRTCISVLTGHNHYVMCASFHPTEDLVLSASLDLTVRVWDISGLRKKTVFSANGGSNSKEFSDRRTNGSNPDMFSSSDFVVKYVLEGHHRGVNWASFHPKLPLIVSAADDREVKLWRMSDIKAWEVDTMRGHINNVSCAIFHPREELIISNSEDKSIRVWDMTRQNAPRAIRRESDRYWILAAHPTLNILAAGHDSGMFMFKLDRERPPFDVYKNLYYYDNKQIFVFNFATNSSNALLTPRRQNSVSGQLKTNPRYLRYNSMNPAEHNILLLSESDGGTYELYVAKKESELTSAKDVQAQRGLGKDACFVSRNRFAVLSLSSRLTIKNFSNETKRTVDLPVANVAAIYSAGTGRILLFCTDKFFLFDIEARKVLSELNVQPRGNIKFVSWSRDRKYCALVSKSMIHICGHDLTEIASLTETSRIKSGAWDEDNIFIYTTSNHIKYCLYSGDIGIIRTLDVPIYITAVRSDTVYYLNRDHQACILKIDNSEATFKRSLLARRYGDVMKTIQSNKLIGQSIIGYLQEKGFPEVALHFVKDERSKFMLALQCGNIEVALECAKNLNLPDCWTGLANAGLLQGRCDVVELAYQQSKQFERLSFFYLITGDLVKLGKMLHISKLREDNMSRFHNALFLGDVGDRVDLLSRTGNSNLAYLLAKAHGLTNEAEAILPHIEGSSEFDISQAQLFLPPLPVLPGSNWPRLEIKRGYFDGAPEDFRESSEDVKFEERQETEADQHVDISTWAEDVDKISVPADGIDDSHIVPGGWGEDLLAALPVLSEASGSQDQTVPVGDYFVMPASGHTFLRNWVEAASLPCDFIAAGEFVLAKKALTRMAGITNFQPLQPHFTAIFIGAQTRVPGVAGTSSWQTGLERAPNKPLIAISLSHLSSKMKEGFKLFMDTSLLQEAASAFRAVLHMVPLIAVSNESEVKEASNIVATCKEYIIATGLALARQEASDVRKCELSALMTICRLQAVHMFLCLYSAIGFAMKLQNFHLTGFLARRFLELSRSNVLPRSLEKAAENIKQVARHCDQNDHDAAPISFDPSEPTKIDALSFEPLPFTSSTVVVCPLCSSVFSNQQLKKVCSTCQIATIGVPSQGLFTQI